MADSETVTTISGHIHTHDHTLFKGTAHLSVGAFSKETPTKPVTGAYAEVTIEDAVNVDVKIRDSIIGNYNF